MTPAARVIVVNYNAGAYLSRCIHALLSQTRSDFEIILVDNASSDGSLDELPADDRIRVIRLQKNIGFAAANNLAAEGSKAPCLVFLNPDAIAERDWMAKLLDAAETSPHGHLFGSLQLRDADPSEIDGAGDAYHFAGTAWREAQGRPRSEASGCRSVFGACAAAALVRRDWFERLGGFDEAYFCYFEDVDLAFRLRLAGGQVLQINDAVVRHAGSATSGAGSPFVVYHCTRNQIWTLLKCVPTPLLLLSAPTCASMMALRWLRAVRAGNATAVGRAMLDALRESPRILEQRHVIQEGRKITVLDVARAMKWSPTNFPGFNRLMPRRR